ncbi:MAG: DUF928 domain-containing protein [Leptolyngbyaceae bacterium]|nr:DUF928 domain-containing protein [Leptolyngbyaceae bacterium]
MIVSATTLLTPLWTLPVVANYIPPRDASAPRPGRTATGGIRGGGCSAAATTGLVPLAPQNHVGRTTSTQPTFAWFNPEGESYLTEFRVAESLPNDRFQVVYQTEFESTEALLPSGISTLSMSDTDIQLSVGKTYRWQVVLVCDPNRPSESLVANVDFAVTDAPNSLAASVASAPTASQRSVLYGEAGFWYDAFNESLAASLADDPEVQLVLLTDLAASAENSDESGSEAVTGSDYGDRLQQVIDIITANIMGE